MRKLLWLPLLMLSCGCAQAASEAAWAEFRANVETACRDLVKDQVSEPRMIVDPFGSSSYGLALVTGTPKGGDTKNANGEAGFICVYDKTSGRAEIGGELDLQPILDQTEK
jgi:hypothetical protein